jgi:hypothetical protein
MLAANYWWAAGHDYIAAFIFSGGYSISAEAVPAPLEVVARGGGGNAPTTYSVTPLYGLQLVNPGEPYYFQNWPAGAVTWTFIRGENVSDDPRSPGVEHIAVNECGFQTTCSYTPPGPGRMEATAWVEGRPVTVRSTPALKGNLELNCNGQRGVNIAVTVTRGDMLDCNVRVTPSGTLRVLGWSFAGGGQVVPAADAPPKTSTGWAGVMVVGGTVSVRALVDQDTVSATAQVTVTARNWVDRIGEPRILYVSCPFPLTAECPLPAVPEHFNDLGRFDLGPGSWPGTTSTIQSGPNEGFTFIMGEDSFLDAQDPWIVLNDVLRQPEHPFWASRKQCNVERFHQESLRHERRHYDGVRQAIEEGGFTPDWLESWYVFGTAAEASAALRSLLSDFQLAMNAAGDLNHTNPEFLNDWHCAPGLEYSNRNQQSQNPKAPGRDRVKRAP